MLKKITWEGEIFVNLTHEAAESIGLPSELYQESLAHQNQVELYDSERAIAKEIMSDYEIGIGVGIADSDIADVKLYMRSINPYSRPQQREPISRPAVFKNYE